MHQQVKTECWAETLLIICSLMALRYEFVLMKAADEHVVLVKKTRADPTLESITKILQHSSKESVSFSQLS